MRYGIAINTENCMACYNCVMACKDEHVGFGSKLTAPQPHEGHNWVRICSKERGDDNRKVTTSNIPVMCSHCENPACMAAAKDGAVYKREDGIVIIDPEKSKGQKQLVDACPAGAIFWNEELQIAQKCTMCAELLDDPEYDNPQPRCVEACPNDALFFGDLDDPDSKINKVIAEHKATPLKCFGEAKTNVKYLNIPTVFLAGSVYLPGDETGEDPADGATVVLTCRECGKVTETKTNYFGDWCVEWLEPNKAYDIKISFDGYKSVELSAETDTDHYVGEVILEAE